MESHLQMFIWIEEKKGYQLSLWWKKQTLDYVFWSSANFTLFLFREINWYNQLIF